jgi:hypothetical protein
MDGEDIAEAAEWYAELSNNLMPAYQWLDANTPGNAGLQN